MEYTSEEESTTIKLIDSNQQREREDILEESDYSSSEDNNSTHTNNNRSNQLITTSHHATPHNTIESQQYNNDDISSVYSSTSTSSSEVSSSSESDNNTSDNDDNSEGRNEEERITNSKTELFSDENNNDQNINFSSEIIDHASSFISTKEDKHHSLSSSPSPSSDESEIMTTQHISSPKAPPTITPPILHDDKDNLIEAPPTSKPHPLKKSKRRCEECRNCLNNTNCKKCRFCKDMTKYGGPGKLRQKCITRQCLKLSRVLAQELASVGGIKDEKGVALSETKTPPITSVNSQPFYIPTSQTTPKTPPITITTSSKTKKQKVQQSKKKPSSKKPSTRKKVLKKRPREKEGGESSDENEELMSYRPTRRRPLSDLYDTWASTVKSKDIKRQCLGPQCRYAARNNSKYCSEECGVELALRRIETCLPKAKEVWQKGEEPVASKLNREKLAQLEQDQMRMKERLSVLDEQSKAINNHVIKMKEIKASKQDKETVVGGGGAETEGDDLTIYCATCGQPTPLKRALIHMERCFAKLEGMVSFGSIVKNEGIDIFCDKYDRSQGTYCKRLKVLCPEHTKEPKAGPTEVCGCPLQADFPSKKNTCTLYCHNLKKNCPGHYCWEKLRRAEIDQEKLNLYLKLEEVSEQCRLYQWQLTYRSSMIAMMLHHTIEH